MRPYSELLRYLDSKTLALAKAVYQVLPSQVVLADVEFDTDRHRCFV